MNWDAICESGRLAQVVASTPDLAPIIVRGDEKFDQLAAEERFASAGCRQWWIENRSGFPQGFRRWIDDRIDSQPS